LNVQLLTGHDRVGSQHRTIGLSLAEVFKNPFCLVRDVARGMPERLSDNVGASLLAMVVNDYACLSVNAAL